MEVVGGLPVRLCMSGEAKDYCSEPCELATGAFDVIQNTLNSIAYVSCIQGQAGKDQFEKATGLYAKGSDGIPTPLFQSRRNHRIAATGQESEKVMRCFAEPATSPFTSPFMLHWKILAHDAWLAENIPSEAVKHFFPPSRCDSCLRIILIGRDSHNI